MLLLNSAGIFLRSFETVHMVVYIIYRYMYMSLFSVFNIDEMLNKRVIVKGKQNHIMQHYFIEKIIP